MSDRTPFNSTGANAGQFATTHWSVVLAAGSPESPRYQEALETLCRTYWFPLYVYLRRHGCDAHQAADYTQAFFAHMLEKQSLNRVQPKPGKFRSFLLTALKHFLADARDHDQAIKRGAGRKPLSLDFGAAESQYALDPATQLSPEKVFDRSWALTMLGNTMDRLEAEVVKVNKRELFESLKVYLCGEETAVPYRDAAAKLDMTEGAVKVAVHRLRRRYRELLHDEIAQTVHTSDQIEEEIQDLFAALAC